MSATVFAGEHPNVVVLLADDLGYKDLGCYDGPVKTPTLDGLAANGVRFTDFYSGAAVCSPSRATLLTGRQHLRAGIYSWINDWEQNSQLLQREVTLAEVLKSHGYETVHLGKWHLGFPTRQKPDKLTPDRHGFDYWFGMANGAHPSHKNPVNFLRNGKPVGKIEGYSCQIVVDEAISWLDEKRDSDKPFFLNVWFHEPHAPIAAPDEIVSRYGDLNDPAAIYSGTIDNTDRAISRLLKKLAEVDAPENTLIIFSSDNGSYRADRVGHLRGTKGSNFEGGIRVPGIFYWPGTITAGHVEQEPAGLVDLLPTVCGLLGIDKPEGVHLDGSDLSPLLTGRADKFNRHQPLFWLLPASGPAIAIRDGNYSLIGNRDYEFPRDKEAMAALRKQIEATLRKNGTFEAEIRGSTLQKQMFEGFKDKEADKLRGQYIRLNMFNESWIPSIKSGTYARFQLFDLSRDPSQKKDLSKQLPNVANRLKKTLLKLNASVMAEAPDWQLAGRTPAAQARALKTKTIQGKVVDASGNAIKGVMVSAFDEGRRQSTSVFSQADGSFAITGLREVDYQVRTRLMGQRDGWLEDVSSSGTDLAITMQPATGDELEDQRPANSGFSMLKFDNKRDKLNFKMMCSYCHQVGTIGFRTPEKPVDWETMLRRMDGFGGLYPHTQKTIVKRLVETYKDDAVNKWPKFVPPPPPTGTAAKVKITAWEIGKRFESSFHDLEIGPDGLVYAVHIGKQYTVTLNPQTGEQRFYKLPVGSYGPHSIELGNDGNMWITLCVSGQIAKFDLKTKKYTICSSAEAPAKRGSFPHTLRINPKDPEGLIWYTDAGRNSCFSLHPKTLTVKEYHLLRADQAVAAGKGESRGITPYGLDFSPIDGTVWYSKLNGNRIGRIDPKVPDGNIKEWNPPFRGPRRLHVAPDGIVWVPGFGSGVFGKFDPKTEKWTVYDLPDAENQIPYALNVDPKGYVWICGTGNDTLNRFNPKTEELVEFRLPMRVSYTREIEFDSEGNVWTSTSGPTRHMERAYGSIIKLEILGDDDGRGGQRLVGYVPKREDLTYEQPRVVDYKNSPNGKLLVRIDRNKLPKGYSGGKQHQIYVDRRLAGLSPAQRSRIGSLWAEKRKADPDMPNAGQSFVRIMEYVAENERSPDKKENRKKKPEASDAGKHFFILSGQSNMQGHRPKEAFTPAVEEALGKNNVIVIQDALGGQPIQRWYKDWKSPNGEKPKLTGDLYDRLMSKVKPSIKGKTLRSVTFIWMQGERDANMRWGKVYETSLNGLYKQLSKDLGRSDVNFVIGRLSDFDLANKKYRDWTMVREIQVKVAESNPKFEWVNTDDLNDGVNRKGKSIKNDLHYSAEGYKTLGKRFADTALKLIKKQSKSQ